MFSWILPWSYENIFEEASYLLAKIIWLNHRIKTTNKTTAFSSVFSLFFQIVIFQYIAAIVKIPNTFCFIKSFKSILLGRAHAPTAPTSNLPMLCSYSVLYHKSTKKGIHFRLSNLCGVLLSLKKSSQQKQLKAIWIYI